MPALCKMLYLYQVISLPRVGACGGGSGSGVGGKQTMYLERFPWCLADHIPPVGIPVSPPRLHFFQRLSSNKGTNSSFWPEWGMS